MIRMVGGLVGCQAEAEALAMRLVGRPRSRPRVGRARFPSRLRVFFEEWDDPLISGIRWVEELVEIAGGAPIFPELAGAALGRDRIVDPAEVARRDPEVVFASWCGKKVKKPTIAGRAGWDRVSAVLRRSDLRGQVDLHPAARPGQPHRRRPPAARAPGPRARARRSTPPTHAANSTVTGLGSRPAACASPSSRRTASRPRSP